MTEFYTPQELAKILRVNREYVYDLIKEGKLKFIKFGRYYRIPSTEVDRLAEEAQSFKE